jgi:hypothetical protein
VNGGFLQNLHLRKTFDILRGPPPLMERKVKNKEKILFISMDGVNAIGRSAPLHIQ